MNEPRKATVEELEKDVRYADQEVEKAKLHLEQRKAYAQRQREALILAMLREPAEYRTDPRGEVVPEVKICADIYNGHFCTKAYLHGPSGDGWDHQDSRYSWGLRRTRVAPDTDTV